MKKLITVGMAALAGLSLAACGNSANSTKSNISSSAKKTHSQYYFDGKTANLHDLKIHIDRVQFYQASEETNNKNLICFDYTITNKTDKDIDAISGWQAVFNAYQDNKNTEGKLEVGALPSDTSDQILHDQTQTIKKNGTVKCRAAYELDSTSKPVVLKATQGVDGKFLGKKTFKLSKLIKEVSESSSVSSSSSSSKLASTNEPSASNGNSAQSVPKDNQTQQSATSNDDKVMIGGHSFHHENAYGTDVLVGDNGEGEAGEWAANDPEVQGNSDVKAQLNSAYGNN